MVTFGGVIVMGIVPGILVAVAMSLLFLIAHLARPADLHLAAANNAHEFVLIGDGPFAHDGDGRAVYRLGGLLMFANSSYVKDRLLALTAGAGNSIRTLVFEQRFRHAYRYGEPDSQTRSRPKDAEAAEQRLDEGSQPLRTARWHGGR